MGEVGLVRRKDIIKPDQYKAGLLRVWLVNQIFFVKSLENKVSTYRNG